jgi:hypothetical protein
MALSLDGTSVTGTATAASTVASAAFTNASANSIIVALPGAEWISSATPGIVTGISGGGLTWHRRAARAVTLTSGNLAKIQQEIWWTFAATALTAQVITATFSSTVFDDAGIVVFSVKGFTGTNYQTNPWDPNAVLGGFPPTASAAGLGASTAPTVAGVSTTNAATMVISVVGEPDNGAYGSGAQQATYTFIANASNNGGTNNMNVSASFLLETVAQTSITQTWVTATAGWCILADALAVIGQSSGDSFATSPAVLMRC